MDKKFHGMHLNQHIQLSFFSILSVFYLIGICYLSSNKFEEKFKRRLLHHDHPCFQVIKISTKENRIILSLNTNNFIPEFIKYFGLNTSAFNQSLFSPPGSAINPIYGKKTVSFEFPLLFITNYSGNLFCVDYPSYILSPSNNPNIDQNIIYTQYPVSIFYDNFSKCNYSQFKMHGNNISNYWFESRNIGFFGNFPMIFTPIIYKFPLFFPTTSSRVTPSVNSYDKEIFQQSLFIRNPYYIETTEIGGDNENGFFIGCPQSDDYFSFMIEFLIPLWNTIKKVKPIGSIHIYTNCIPTHYIYLIRSFLRPSVTIGNPISEFSKPSFFRHFTFGVEKIEEGPNISCSLIETYDNNGFVNINQLLLKYPECGYRLFNHGHIFRSDPSFIDDFKKNMLDGFKYPIEPHSSEGQENELEVFYREKVFNRTTITNSQKLRICLFIDEHVKNWKELEKIMKEMKNDIEIINMKDIISYPNIIETIAASDVIIGKTNENLTNLVFLKKNGVLLEIKPPEITRECDDRYETLSHMAELRYFEIEPESIQEKIFRKIPLKYNINEDNECLKSYYACCCKPNCYKFYQSLDFDIDVDKFKFVWNLILEYFDQRSFL